MPRRAPKIAENWPPAPPPRQGGRVTTLRHIDALLGTSWAWEVEDDDENLVAEDLRAEVDAMLDELVFDAGSTDDTSE